MSNSRRVDEVKFVKQLLVEIGSISRTSFLDQKLVSRTTNAIIALGTWDSTPQILDIHASVFLLEVYKTSLPHYQVLSQKYVQWSMDKKLCAKHHVPFTAPRPKIVGAPIDLAYTTLVVRRSKPRDSRPSNHTHRIDDEDLDMLAPLED